MEQLVYFGKESIFNLKKLLLDKRPKRVFLVRSKTSYESCGAKKKMDDIFSILGCDLCEFVDFEENPKYNDLRKGISLLSNFKADFIISVGGGSVLDMAKLIRFFYSYSNESLDNLEYIKKKKLIPLVVLPTTAGTGSEATHFAVLYKNKIKHSIAHEDILPEVVVIYPPFTYNNPPYLTSCTGFDALAQAIEAYWNINATDESDKYAMKAIKLLYPNLPLIMNMQQNCGIRDALCEGAYWAGKAINITKTTAPHAFSYPFTTFYGIPHGHAVALTFPFIATINIPSLVHSKQVKLISVLKISDITKIKSFCLSYILSIGLNFSLPIDFDKIKISKNINIQRLSNNPVKIDNDMVRTIIDGLISISGSNSE